MFFRGDLSRAFAREECTGSRVRGGSPEESSENKRGMAKAAGAIQLTALDFPFNGFGRVPHYIRIAPVE